MNSISIVIGIHNRADLFKRSLESYVLQEFPGDWEIIVCDNQSDDGLDELLKSYQGKIPRIVHIKTDLSKGPRPIEGCHANGVAVSTNIGFKHAQYQRVIRTDPETIQVTKTLFQASEMPLGETFYCGVYDMGDSDNDKLVKNWDAEKNNIVEFMGWTRDNLLVSWWFFMLIVDREIFMKIHGVDEDFTGAGGEDDNFWGRISKVSKCSLHSEIQCIHQWHGSRTWIGSEEHQRNCKLLGEKSTDPDPVVNKDRDWGSDECVEDIIILE